MSSRKANSVTYTCITCGVGFGSGEDQRIHYKSDWHRYNLKRKVAGMVPVSAEGFRDRVLAQQAEDKMQVEAASEHQCTICSKKFNSSNAYENHLNSKKHKEAAARPEPPVSKQSSQRSATTTTTTTTAAADAAAAAGAEKGQTTAAAAVPVPASSATATATATATSKDAKTAKPAKQQTGTGSTAMDVGADGDEEEAVDEDDDEDIEEVDEFDSPLGLEDCIFCSEGFDTFEANLKHMSSAHSFFVPDMEFLVDLEGLIAYLQAKAAVYFECLKCNGRGRGFQSLEAVRKHMIDKGHCMIDYSEDGALELSEYYDFSSSYPDHEEVGDEAAANDALVVAPLMQLSEETGEYAAKLKTGEIIGHRSLRTFYRQHYKREDTRESVIRARQMAQYKAIGSGEAVPDLDAAARRHRQKDIARMQRERLHAGMQANNQAHHRPQMLQ